MASLNLSINGPSIKSSYQGVINASTSNSSSFATWALFSVQAPLANAFQDSGNKESVLKVQSTGEGELEELLEDFNEGRIQFAFIKIKDPNSGLPKYALIAWCGGGVPERTKGYFTSHLNAVSKVLHGYHVQITARSETDLEPANILQKVADASGSKYTAGGSAPVKSSGAPPPVKSKPVFPTTNSTASISFNPIIAARNANLRQKTNDDGWGEDAPQVSRSEIQRVESAYKPTKVDINALRSQAPTHQDDRPDVVRGAYQPIGKVDINAIRAAAKEKQDDRPAAVKGAYEPVGKVDIAAIRAKAQKPAEHEHEPEPEPEETSERPKSLSERSAAFNQSERITELPKPKVAKKFGGAPSYGGTGTKPLNPGGFGLLGPAGGAPVNPQVGSAGRSFQAAASKTPAQIWAEKKAAQGGGGSTSSVSSPAAPSPVEAQKSGGWQSGYAGKSWGTVQTGGYSRGIPGQKTGDTATSQDHTEPETKPQGVSSLKDRFKDAAPIGVAAGAGAAAGAGIGAAIASHDDQDDEEESAPPPPPPATRPSDAPSGGFALPGMPPRPPPVTDEEEEEEEEPEPIRVAQPVARGPEPEIEPATEPPRSLPVRSIAQELPREEDLPDEEETYDPRAASQAVAEQQFGEEQVADAPAASGGKRALVQYDYEKAEDNEVELREGEYVTNIEMVDEDWWMGTNTAGESGLFPSNYVELVDDDDSAQAAAPAPPLPPPAAAEPEPEPEQAAGGGAIATASFDYEAAEDNELSFPEGAKITNLEFPDDDWWFGHYQGASGLFPANYVELDQ
ncbi:hypothetical protein BKA67DRAFT_538432 [Truncatella angustata]|uniref:Actin binding protein n=1 Tax=Truncatella angustata TaxID=152316 RepID=A0A9P8UEC7_9PEZI|nr:uncharacterized protein BKA67DRAFT_538432 [Truncatella angustata]KAH6648392.1 hypothetical protein BKA67DRAFT_538432 [Truncatella angustata]KAH8204829.1 hypothetical protein TruAng_001018 [Truncatella angustata]